MIKDIVFILKSFLVYTALSVACLLMLTMVLQYTAFRDDVYFLNFKQEFLHNPTWKTAFYIHVFSAVFALFAGFTQFSTHFLTQHRQSHRFIGKLYAWNVLVINVPVGMILALCANGGLWAKLAFIILDCLWFYFTYQAIVYARKRDFQKHRDFMVRSYALTLSAITLRGWKIILSDHFDLDPTQLYIIQAWIAFIPNLLLAEYIIQRCKRT